MRTVSVLCILLFSLVFSVYAQPDIDPADTHHDFGQVGVGVESGWDLVLLNVGDDALYVSSVTPNLSEFTIVQPTFPITMTPGESLAVTVVFQPTAVGHISGFIEVVSNDPDEGLVSIGVEGEGVDVAHISAPDSLVPAGAQVFLPLFIDDATGLGIMSIEMRMVFDESMVTASGASLIGTIAESWSLSVESGTDQIEISLSGPTPLVGSGVVVYIDMSVSATALPGQSSPLILTDVTFNDGVPLAVPHDGLLTVAHYDISGEIVYYRGDRPVDNVLLSLHGGAVGSTWTDDSGFYRLESVPGGRDYTVTPSKVGDVYRCINSYDASLVMRYSVSLVSLDPHQLLVADVTGDESVGPFDVSFILRLRVGIIDQFPIGDEWLFLPEKMDYDSLSSHQSDQDYIALAYGDVSGNWSGGGAMKEVVSASGLRVDPSVVVSTTKESSVFSVPVLIEQAEGIGAADFEFRYDARQLNVISVRPSSFTSDYQLYFHDQEGCLRVAMAGTKDLYGDGTLFHLVFEVSSASCFDSGVPLEISAIVNDGLVIADGQRVSLSLSKSVVPVEYGLDQNWPNPFNPSTEIHYRIAESQEPVHTTLRVYTLLGQVVKTLVDTQQEPGSYTVSWDGRDACGQEAASGIYFYRIVAGTFMSTKHMVLVR